MAIVKPQPVYCAIADRLRLSIRKKRLVPGTVLLEAPLAKLFGSSRSPVKQALEDLEREGLLSRLDGRGFLVGPARAKVNRLKLTPHALDFASQSGEELRIPTWKTIYERIERELIFRSIFGQFRINELELSRYYSIGRTVAHDVLTQLQATGIIAKRHRVQWLTVPLDHKRVNDLFDLRTLLEPALGVSAIGRMPEHELEAIRSRLLSSAAEYPEVKAPELDELENDLHVRILERGANQELFEALGRTRCILISGKHILGRGVPYPSRPEMMFDEHLRVVEALKRRDAPAVRRELLAHLEASRQKVLARLAAFREKARIEPISFISA